MNVCRGLRVRMMLFLLSLMWGAVVGYANEHFKWFLVHRQFAAALEVHTSMYEELNEGVKLRAESYSLMYEAVGCRVKMMGCF